LPVEAAEIESINRASPFGAGLRAWLKNSPGFNLNRVKAPVRLETHSRASLLGEWEWFAGLWRLGKPVELVLIPDAVHAPVKPLERLVSQQGAVDWLRFWLEGEEDSDQSKIEQYARWRELRKLQEQTNALEGSRRKKKQGASNECRSY
jgi:hypothetical protein